MQLCTCFINLPNLILISKFWLFTGCFFNNNILLHEAIVELGPIKLQCINGGLKTLVFPIDLNGNKSFFHFKYMLKISFLA